MSTKREVPFFNYKALFAEREADFLATMKDVLNRGAFILQRDCLEFEANIRKYLGVKHAIGMANCTDALLIALRAAGVKPGDEVILPSHTFVATAAAIHFAGAVPVPVECGEDHMADPEAIRKAVTSKTTAIMPVQLNGRTCKMDLIQAIADEHELVIVEDSAQGLGSKYKGKFAGTFGLAGTFSFYPAKILGCFGDGGMLITNDDRVAEEAELVRDHGRNKEGEVVIWGLNSRLDNMQAAVLNYQFQYYRETIEKRRERAARYDKNLRDLSFLKLPPAPEADSDHFDTFQNYEIQAERRDELKTHLKEAGIGTLIQWGGKAIHQHAKLGPWPVLPKTEELFKRCLLLPMNPMLSLEDVDYVSETIRSFYAR